MYTRIRHKTMGSHVHMRVFVGEAPNLTLGKAGDLCMSVAEFNEWVCQVRSPGVIDFCEESTPAPVAKDEGVADVPDP